jgi:hypothetical protein
MIKYKFYTSLLYENGDELCNIEGDTINSLKKQAKKIIKDIKEPEHKNPHYTLRAVIEHVEYDRRLENIKL